MALMTRCSYIIIAAVVTCAALPLPGCGGNEGRRGGWALVAAATGAVSTATGTGRVAPGAQVAVPTTGPAGSPLERASVVGGVLRDRLGRQLLLRGGNLSQRAKHPPFTGWARERHLDDLVRWGFDHVRLLVTWEAIEPRDGVFDDTYLDEVRRILDWCEARGLYAVLDMHQDMFARRFAGCGAPAWALAPDPCPWLADDI